MNWTGRRAVGRLCHGDLHGRIPYLPTEEGEKLEVERMAAKTGSMEQAIRVLAAEKNSGKR